MKAAVYGTGQIAQNFCYSIEKDFEILYFVQTKKTMDYFHNKKVVIAEDIDYSKIDYLFIATDIYYEEIIAHLKALDNSYELYKHKIVKASEWSMKIWRSFRKYMPYASCKVCKDLVYVVSSEDDAMGGHMFKSGRNIPETMIHTFFELTEKYYKEIQKNRDGYFLDIGANIGTTSIYVKKKINRDLRIIGFEPGKSNYDLFRVNCILNQVEDIKVELLGLSDSNTKRKYRYIVENSGGSGIVGDGYIKERENEKISIVNMMKLDDYLEKNGIPPEEIEYIWIDTEGHEYEIITGGFKTLLTKKIPFLQEFNPYSYIVRKNLEFYCQKIGEIYDYFLDVHEYISGQINIIPIVQIYDFAKRMIKEEKEQTDLFFF